MAIETNDELADVRKMLAWLSDCPNYENGYSDWLNVCSALGNHFGEETALRLMVEFFPDQKRNETEYKIKHRKRGTGIGTFIKMCRDLGYKGRCVGGGDYKVKKIECAVEPETTADYGRILGEVEPRPQPKRRRFFYPQGYRFAVCVNLSVVNKNYLSAADLNGNWENAHLTVLEMMHIIGCGHAVIFAGMSSYKRSREHFTFSEIFALDFDNTCTVEDFLSKLVGNDRNLFLFAYTTASHTEEKPRFRAVFGMPNLVDTAQDYEAHLREMIKKYGSDAACSDACRIFYGNTNAKFFFVPREENYQNSEALISDLDELFGVEEVKFERYK